MKEKIKPSQVVLNYMKKYQCNLIKKFNFGIPQYRILKDGVEKKYPHITEDIYCEIRNKIKRIGKYNIPESGIFKLIKPT